MIGWKLSISRQNWGGSGGGIGCSENAIIYDCIISGNVATAGGYYGGGGGIDLGGRAENCLIINNFATNGGGVVFDEGGHIRNSIIKNNVAWGSGGGITGSDGNAWNCLIVGNSAAEKGGGVYYVYGLINCTIVNNTAGNAGGGVHIFRDYLINSIICYNTSTISNNVYDWGAYDVPRYNCSYPFLSGEGNISNIPEFVDMASGNYRLKSFSPCIDRGTNDYWNGSFNKYNDLDGNPRIIDGRIDMGCYEYIPEPVIGFWLFNFGFLIYYLKKKK